MNNNSSIKNNPLKKIAKQTGNDVAGRDDLNVVPVTTRTERKAFLNFPWHLYRDDPNWTPPIRFNQRQLVNYRPHPFYENAEVQTFIARRQGEVVGRIAAIVDRNHNIFYKEQRGMFGFFESINDQSVANCLFDAARNWLDDRGIKCMRGPMNPSMNYECGLLVDGFDTPATFMMTYNPDYYPLLIERYGFGKSQDLYAFWGHVSMLDTLDPKIRRLTDEAAKRLNVTVRPISRKIFGAEVRKFMEIYNRAVMGNWGFVPMSESEIDHTAKGLKNLIVPELTSIGEANGKTVGFIFGLLDYNPLIKKMNGRLFPFGFLRILFQKRQINRVRLVSTNIAPEYQKWGLVMVLLQDVLERAISMGHLTEAEFSWVLESNTLSRGSLERGGAKLIKTFRIYDFDWT